MNALSWFLYFADVTGNLRGLLLLFTVVGGVASIMAFFGWLMQRDLYGADSVTANTLGSISFKLAPVVVVCAILSALMPSKETIYLIAGSEAGETIVASPQGQEILNDVQEVIRYQLSQLKDGNEWKEGK